MKKALAMFGYEICATAVCLLLLAAAGLAQAQDNGTCFDWAANDLQLEVTEKFTLSGPELIDRKWTAPHDTMTIQFRDEPPMIWNPDNTSKPGLLDYIWTAAHHEAKTGSPAFAGRNAEGYIWIISKLAEPGTPNTIPCFAHPLGWSK